jgi:hypothetical protein
MTLFFLPMTRKTIATFLLQKFWLVLFAAGLSTPALSQGVKNAVENHERWYQVELIIFSRKENLSQQETWSNKISLKYPENLISLNSIETISRNGFNMLPPEERQLNTQANSIAKNGNYSLLYHQAWRQMITRKKTSILIQGGKTFNGHQELEGSISLSVSLYLQLQTNLWLTQFGLATGEVNEGWPELPALPNSNALATDAASDYVITRIIKMDQQRNMRSQDLNYIDHPLMGIIIKIIPVNP